MPERGPTTDDAVFEILEQTATENTKVLFTFPDATQVEILVPHFQPRDQAEIELGIRNRWVSELRAIETERSR